MVWGTVRVQYANYYYIYLHLGAELSYDYAKGTAQHDQVEGLLRVPLAAMTRVSSRSTAMMEGLV
jgi:hypothetical protein